MTDTVWVVSNTPAPLADTVFLCWWRPADQRGVQEVAITANSRGCLVVVVLRAPDMEKPVSSCVRQRRAGVQTRAESFVKGHDAVLVVLSVSSLQLACTLWAVSM